MHGVIADPESGPSSAPASEVFASLPKAAEITLAWRDLSKSIVIEQAVSDAKEGVGRSQRQLLHNVNGIVRPGEILALMGPSGSGT